MPIVTCPGPDCGGRRISVSAIPGGNPVAGSAGFATSYLVCDCGRVLCDRCGRAGCPACGGVMHAPSDREARDLADRVNGLFAGEPSRRPSRGPLRRFADWLRGG